MIWFKGFLNWYFIIFFINRESKFMINEFFVEDLFKEIYNFIYFWEFDFVFS